MKKIATIILGFSLASAQAQNAVQYFDGNAYNVLINASGNHFWDYTGRKMFVPSSGGTSGRGSIYASTIWIGGFDNANQLHFAGERFVQLGQDFNAGPISANYDSSFVYNQLWKINRSEIEDWIVNGTSSPTQPIVSWPGNGRTQAPYFEATNLAPFYDANNDGIYNVNDMDYPLIRGDQSIYFMYNDGEFLNTESGGNQMLVEVHGMVYGFNCPEDTILNQTLFMHYEIFNRSDENYSDVYVGLWNDFDLGNPIDDQIGCDPLRNLFYANNGDNMDEDVTVFEGYGNQLPAQGVKILKGLKMDADNMDNAPGVLAGEYSNGVGFGDGVVDNEYVGLAHFAYHSNEAGPLGDPEIAQEYYSMLSGYWKNGAQFTYGGNGYNAGNPNPTPARFMFPDGNDTLNFGTYGVPATAWNESNSGILPGDRRGFGSMGPVTMPAGEKIEFDIAYIFSGNNSDRLIAVEKLKAYSDHIQELFDSGTTPCGDFEVVYPLSVKEIKEGKDLKLYPNPANGQVFLNPELGNAFEVNIYSLDGKLVTSLKSNHPTITIDVSDFSNGIYFVTASGEYLSKSTKLIVNQ